MTAKEMKKIHRICSEYIDRFILLFSCWYKGFCFRVCCTLYNWV